MADLINVYIDDVLVQVPKGTVIVDAAKKVGVDIPVFCYHPKMKPVGMCRMCMVEVYTPKMDPATRQPVILRTQSRMPSGSAMPIGTGSGRALR